MNVRFKTMPARGDKIIRIGFGGAFSFIIFSLVYIFINLSMLPPFIPLFNQMPWGEQRLGTREQIFIPLAISFSICLLNFFFAQLTYQKSALIARILCITTAFISFFTLLFTVRIINLVL